MKTIGKLLITLLLPLFLSSFITSTAADFTRERTGYRTMGVTENLIIVAGEKFSTGSAAIAIGYRIK